LITIKKRAFRRYKRNANQANMLELKKTNALFRRSVKEARNENWIKFADSIQNTKDPVNWQKARKIINGYKANYIKYIEINGQMSESGQEIANYFSDCYSQGFENIQDAQSYTNSEHEPNSNEVTDKPITINEIKQALRNSKGKTPGIDAITYTMIRHSPAGIYTRLAKLYNNIFNSCHFPYMWKLAELIPIVKPNKNAKKYNSYRFISLITILSKIFERILSKRIKWLAESKIEDNIHGFRPFRGTSSILHMVEINAAKALEKKEHVDLYSLDLEKAFDKVKKQGVV
jgi:hypothetical protein